MKNEFPVSIYGKIEKFSDTISRARVRIFYKGLNRNATYITEEFAEKLVSTLSYAPIKAATTPTMVRNVMKVVFMA